MQKFNTSTTFACNRGYYPSFVAGDVILCPSIGDLVYELSDSKNGFLSFSDDTQTYYCHDDGRFNPTDILPSIFHDTMENGNAIITLYGDIADPLACTQHTSRPIQTSQPQQKVINFTNSTDDEVVVLSSMMLSDIACDLDGAISAFNDVGHLLSLIYNKKIDASTIVSLARLSHDSTMTWADTLCHQLNDVSEPLSLTRFCIGVVDEG